MIERATTTILKSIAVSLSGISEAYGGKIPVAALDEDKAVLETVQEIAAEDLKEAGYEVTDEAEFHSLMGACLAGIAVGVLIDSPDTSFSMISLAVAVGFDSCLKEVN